MKTRFRRTVKPIIVATTLLGTCLPAIATEDNTQQYSITSQSLSSALNQIKQQSGLSLIFDTTLTNQYQAKAIEGNFTTREALEQLLSGTGLTYRFDNTSTIIIEAAVSNASKEATQLDSLRIVGSLAQRYEADSASSAMGIETDIIDTPRSIQVVNEQIIQDQQAQDLRDVLKNVSGVQTRNISGGTTDAFVIRGIEVDNIYVNGLQLDRNSQRIQTANMERVEVVKGANAILVGQSQPGGVINVVTKKPQEKSRHTIDTSFDEFGRKELTLDTTGKVTESGSVLYRFVASTEDSDTFRETDEKANIRRDLIAPSLTWKISDADTLTASLEYSDSTIPFDSGTVLVRDDDGNIDIADVDSSVRFGEDEDRSESTQTRFQLEYEHLFENDWALKSNIQYQDGETLISYNNPLGSSFLTQGVVLSDGQLLRLPTAFDNESKRLLVDLKLNGYLEWGVTEHEIVIGMDYNRRKFKVDRDFAMLELFPGTLIPNGNFFNIFDPVYNQANSSPEQTTFSKGDLTDEQLGFFVQDLISIGEHWKLLVGLRGDRFKRESTDTFFFSGDGVSITPRAEPEKRDLGQDTQYETSPNVGLVFQPTPELSLFASYSESFQANNQRYNTTTFETSDLKPTEGEQIELGIKGSLWDNKLGFNLAYFDIMRTNVPSGFDTVNDAEHSQGVELDTNVQFFEGLNLIFNYAYIDAEIEEGSRAGNTPRNVPDDSANLWLTYEFTEGSLQGLGLGGGASYVGERYMDAANSLELDSHTTYDATAFYYLPVAGNSQLRFQLGVKNITDEDVYSPNTSGVNIGVGAPRTVYGSISLEFN